MLQSSAEGIAAERLSGSAVVDIAPVTGGGNNQIWRIACADALYALKKYPDVEVDQRDRLSHEIDALRFLQNCGVTEVPRPVAVDREARYGLYEWISGKGIAAEWWAIDAMLDFMRRLHGLRRDARAKMIGLAVEAVPAATDLSAQIVSRIGRLDAVRGAEPELSCFLDETIMPLWSAGCAAAESADTANLTLSPSDFGTHNMLKRDNGAAAFLDFEYFGWDDPVKLVSDVLWHPGMTLRMAQRRYFFAEARVIYQDDRSFVDRFRARHPLFGLRWALIVLDEFLPASWQRRTRAGATADWVTAKSLQLIKSIGLADRSRAAMVDGGRDLW